MDDATALGYVDSVRAAVRGGINFLDTSLNYRHQESERNFGEALSTLFESGEFDRAEIAICTKAGYLVPNAMPQSGVGPDDIVGRMHCLTPAFLADQLGRSLANLRVDSVDVFYLHNPETQLQFVSPAEFEKRIAAAFAACEEMAAAGRLSFYGTATWNGYRTREREEGLSVTRLAAIAREVGGETHRFRFIQLPLNLAMLEGVTFPRETIDGENVSTVEAARRLGIASIASASLLQTRLAQGLPETVRDNLPGLETDAQRAIQFARSAPGIVSALVGMSTPAHVAENLKVAGVAPANLSAWFRPSH